MKRTLRYGLLAGASGLALGIAVTSTSALAFNDVDWDWHADVKTDFKFDPKWDINDEWDIFPEGLAMVESIQVQVGNVTSSSVVRDVTNNQHGTKQAAEDISFKFQSEMFDNESEVLDNNDIEPYDGETTKQEGFDDGNPNDTETTFGDLDESFDDGINDQDWAYNDVSGTDEDAIDVIGGVAYGGSCETAAEEGEEGCVVMEVSIDADSIKWVPENTFYAPNHLPETLSAATSVANNLSVTADAGTLMHNGQYAFGNFNNQNVEPATLISAAASLGVVGSTGNTHHDALIAAAALAQAGLITRGLVDAESIVTGITNNSVDSSATAISNNISASVNPYEEGEVVEDVDGNPVTAGGSVQVLGGSDFDPKDHLLIADYSQFSYMNVDSSSTVRDVSVSNYTGLGQLDGPLVNSTATSVGNNISVNVGN